MSTVWDASTSNHNLPPSLYMTTKPNWFGNTPWPGIGPDVAGYCTINPAQQCYLWGMMPACLTATGVQNNSFTEMSTVVFPNPFSSTTAISSNMKNCSIKIFDVTGSVVKSFSNVSQFPFTIERGNLSSGIYFLELRNENKVERMKLIIN